MEKSYKNLGYILILFIPLTFVAFYKTYFSQVPTFEENITTAIHLHALIASIWIIMLIAQPLLIKNGKINLHRSLGKTSYVIFPLLILSFIPQMIRLFNSDNPNFLFYPLADCLALVLFYSLAIYYRKNTSKHMRYMIGTAIVFLGPTFGRIGTIVLGLSDLLTQNLQYLLIFLILFGLIALDRKHNKKCQPYLLILGTWIVHMSVFHFIF